MQNLLGHSVVAESLKHNRAKEEKEGKKAQFFFELNHAFLSSFQSLVLN